LTKRWQAGLEWALLLLGLVLVTLASPGQAWALWGVLALLASFGVRAWRTGRFMPRSGLEAPWLLFITSAALAAWISFAHPQALLQFSRLLAAFVLFCALAEANFRKLRIAGWIMLAGAGFATVFWILTHDFSSDPGKFAIITRLGEIINGAVSSLPRLPISGNVTGGTLAMSAPVGIAVVYLARREGRRGQALAAGLLTMLTLSGLLLTSSRGAMLGMTAAGGLALLAWAQVRWAPRMPGKSFFWLAVALVFVLATGGLVVTGNLERLVGSVPDPTGSLQSRLQIWQQGATLIGDYIFTGAGLGTFPIVFSIYRLLIHVPFHEHMHNIFLETWFEQGVLGVIAMMWGMGVLAVWAWRALTPAPKDERHSQMARRILGWAGMASLLAMGVHGMLDVVFYLKPTMPLVGLVAAFAVQLSPLKAGIEKASVHQPRRWILLTCSLAVIMLALIFARPMVAASYANLGALLQTRQEMSAYKPDRFDSPSLDQFRRELNLDDALQAWHRALVFQPDNRTALQRLVQVALSRGEYAQALAYMQSAWDAGRHDQVTRLLYSDALVANGSPEAGAELLAGIPWAAGRLYFQAWYRYWLAEDYPRAVDVYKAILVLAPGNADAQYWLEQAQERIK
jgi:O-antigen ligase